MSLLEAIQRQDEAQRQMWAGLAEKATGGFLEAIQRHGEAYHRAADRLRAAELAEIMSRGRCPNG